jgi:hypothetical protein
MGRGEERDIRDTRDIRDQRDDDLSFMSLMSFWSLVSLMSLVSLSSHWSFKFSAPFVIIPAHWRAFWLTKNILRSLR